MMTRRRKMMMMMMMMMTKVAATITTITRRLTLPMAMLWVERLRVYNCTKCTKRSRPSLGRFSRGFQHSVEKLSRQNQTDFFRISKSLLPPNCILWSWVRSKSSFWTSLPHPKELRKKKLNFSIAVHLQLPGTVGEDRLTSKNMNWVSELTASTTDT